MLKTVKCQKFHSADRGIVQKRDHAMVSIFSDYYNTAARIIVLMEETCNMFIDMARKFLDPGSIFQIEVEGKESQFFFCLQIYFEGIHAFLCGDNIIDQNLRVWKKMTIDMYCLLKG